MSATHVLVEFRNGNQKGAGMHSSLESAQKALFSLSEFYRTVLHADILERNENFAKISFSGEMIELKVEEAGKIYTLND